MLETTGGCTRGSFLFVVVGPLALYYCSALPCSACKCEGPGRNGEYTAMRA